jgi:hypothetical protein
LAGSRLRCRPVHPAIAAACRYGMGFETTVRRPLVEVALDWQTDAEPRSIAQLWRASLLTSAGRASETGAQRPPPRGPPPTTASSPKRVASTRTCPRTRSCDAQRTCARRTRSGPLCSSPADGSLETLPSLTKVTGVCPTVAPRGYRRLQSGPLPWQMQGVRPRAASRAAPSSTAWPLG